MSKAVMFRAGARFRLPVVFLLGILALAACSGDRQEQVSSGSTLATDSPATENTGAVEQPLPAGGDDPGISLASLPIGLNEGSAGTDVQCIQVAWSGDEFPSGVTARVSRLKVTSEEYDPVGSGCQGPSCTDYVYRSSGDSCDLPVRASRTSPPGESVEGTVTVSADGQVLCTDPAAEACTSFAGALDGPETTVNLTLPSAEQAPENPGSGTSGPPEETTDSSGG